MSAANCRQFQCEVIIDEIEIVDRLASGATIIVQWPAVECTSERACGRTDVQQQM
jgi:hypothetical protein